MGWYELQVDEDDFWMGKDFGRALEIARSYGEAMGLDEVKRMDLLEFDDEGGSEVIVKGANLARLVYWSGVS